MEQNLVDERLKVVSPVVRELEIDIPPEEVKKEYEKVVSNYVSKVRLPGFRQGHAPREMVARMFAAEIKDALLDSLVPEYLKRELEARGGWGGSGGSPPTHRGKRWGRFQTHR